MKNWFQTLLTIYYPRGTDKPHVTNLNRIQCQIMWLWTSSIHLIIRLWLSFSLILPSRAFQIPLFILIYAPHPSKASGHCFRNSNVALTLFYRNYRSDRSSFVPRWHLPSRGWYIEIWTPMKHNKTEKKNSFSEIHLSLKLAEAHRTKDPQRCIHLLKSEL